jgi:hypothetical protein
LINLLRKEVFDDVIARGSPRSGGSQRVEICLRWRAGSIEYIDEMDLGMYEALVILYKMVSSSETGYSRCVLMPGDGRDRRRKD